jgi:hypothetical protein
MNRQPRIEYPRCALPCHGEDRQERIVHDEIDRYRLIKTLGRTSRKDAGISTVASRWQKNMTAFLPAGRPGIPTR